MKNSSQFISWCLGIRKYVCISMLISLGALAQSDSNVGLEHVEFKTLEPWKAPRLYYFFKISSDLSKLVSLSNSKGQVISLPLKALDSETKCPNWSNIKQLKAVSSAQQEVLISNNMSWLAIRVIELENGKYSGLQDFSIELKNGSGSCTYTAQLNSIKGRQEQSLIPNIVFSSSEHRFSNYKVQIKEDFLVAMIRYRIEASTRFRKIGIADQSAISAVLAARGSFWVNGYGNLGSDFQILQSIYTFNNEMSLSEWAFSINSSLFLNLGRASLILKPHLGFRQQLLLGSEENEAFTLSSRSISMFHVGGSLDLELGSRYLVRGRGELGIKEFEKVAPTDPEWRYILMSGALGYRLRPELRLLIENTIHIYKLNTQKINKLDFISFGIEMDF